MAKEEGIIVDGTVDRIEKDRFIVKLGNDQEVVCTISGKIRTHFIRINPDDKVQIEISPYDLKRGRIKYRYK